MDRNNYLLNRREEVSGGKGYMDRNNYLLNRREEVSGGRRYMDRNNYILNRREEVYGVKGYMDRNNYILNRREEVYGGKGYMDRNNYLLNRREEVSGGKGYMDRNNYLLYCREDVSVGKGYMDRKNSHSSVSSGSNRRYFQTSKSHGKALEGEVAGSNQDPATLKNFNLIERIRSFQISATPVKLKPSLFHMNREKRELQRSTDCCEFRKLRPGMVLLKKYISLNDQVEILRTCEELGYGPGGFHQPGYRNGGKLRLKMTCMGKNWDPESGYDVTRVIDGDKPAHNIDDRFKDLVRRAIQASHSRLQQSEEENSSIEKMLPYMTPDLCIINFYSKSGKLGLHQDKDESPESIKKGLPVVSFSIGDSADFLYGTERDERKAERITLESGDVLIFGGDSRLIFHGVDCIHPNTTPRPLVNQFKLALLPGRLNLTFRKY